MGYHAYATASRFSAFDGSETVEHRRDDAVAVGGAQDAEKGVVVATRQCG